MIRIKSILTTIGLVILVTAHGQINQYGKKGALNSKQIDQLNAERQIKNLHEGILLVRLRTRLPLIEALEKRGRYYDAERVKQKQREENKVIISTFKTYFDFCPTYFFNSNYSDFIRDDMLDSVIFVNDSAVEDRSIQLPNKLFFIAEFTRVSKDTATFAAGTYLYRGENGLERRTAYEGGGNYGFEALVFKSPDFYQLRRPFPYYSRTLESLPIFRRSPKRVVQRANEALFYYYNKIY